MNPNAGTKQNKINERHGERRRSTFLWHIIRNTISGHKLLSLMLIIIVIGAILLALIPPLLLEQIVNQLVDDRNIEIQFAFLYFGMLVLSGLFDAGKEIFVTIFGQKITHGLRSEMCRKLSRLKVSYYTENEPGSITSRIVNDVDTVESLFANGVISMCVDICKVLSIIVVIFTKSSGLGILLLIVSPLLFILTRLFQKRMLKAQKANRNAVGRVNQYIPETLGSIRTIHCLVKKSYMEKQYDKKIQESYRAVEKTNLYDSVYSPVIIMISTCIIAAVMILSAWGGGMREFFGMSVGTAVAVIAYVGKVFNPIAGIGMELQNIQSAIAGISRINELLSEDEQHRTDASITIEELLKNQDKGISFDNVEFSYDGIQKILENQTFSINSGEMVTLAGRTGAGKSTLFKLLLGLYSPQAGNVRIFGYDAALIPNNEKRRLFGYVEQSFHIIPGNVAEQISMYDESISMEAVINAAKLAGIHDSVMAMPGQYETDCKTAGFSQGQLQLLSIARAVAANPPVILLDEITANLDSITEHKILSALEKAAEGRTVISISHRLYESLGNRIISI